MSFTEAEEKTILGADFTATIQSLTKNIEQMEAGFFRLNQSTGFEETNPLDRDSVEKNPELDTFQKETGIAKANLFLPFGINEDIVEEIQALLAIGDPLNMSEDELASLQSRSTAVANSISVPTADELTDFLNAYAALISSATGEDESIPVQIQEIIILSTDINLDSFIARTGFKKAMIIELNRLQFPYISYRLQIPSQKQATLTGHTGTVAGFNLSFTTIAYEINAGTAEVGSQVLISNNARFDEDVVQQKSTIDWIDVTAKELKLKDALLFDVDSTYSVEIFQGTVYQVLEVGKTIKVPA